MTTDTVRRVKSQLGVMLTDQAVIFEQLQSDPVLLADVLYVVHEDQAEKRGISDREFGRRLAGDAIEDAVDALVEAIIDFFPQRRRGPLQKVWRTAKTAAQTQSEIAEAELSDELLQKIVDSVTKETRAEMAKIREQFGG